MFQRGDKLSILALLANMRLPAFSMIILKILTGIPGVVVGRMVVSLMA